jgi:hypothetical protein
MAGERTTKPQQTNPSKERKEMLAAQQGPLKAQTTPQLLCCLAAAV